MTVRCVLPDAVALDLLREAVERLRAVTRARRDDVEPDPSGDAVSLAVSSRRLSRYVLVDLDSGDVWRPHVEQQRASWRRVGS